MKKRACYLTTMLALSGGAHAAITYVDATTGNTTLANGTAYTPTATTVSNDNQWSNRAFGNSGGVYTANDSNSTPGEDAPELRTTISLLTPGETYSVYVYYWTGGNDTPTGNTQWDISAGFTSGSTTNITAAAGTNLGAAVGGVNPATYFTNSSPTVSVSDSDRRLREYYLGDKAAGAGGNIDVYINDFPGNINRTWYDGVGYEIVPEPSSALLAGIGLLGLLRRRRA
jgi:hypothetical protein